MRCVIVGDSLSVVMPVFNEETHLAGTIDALATAIDGGGFEAEVILVDDGSTDGSAAVARSSADGRVPLRVLAQSNRGRFEARRTGRGSIAPGLGVGRVRRRSNER